MAGLSAVALLLRRDRSDLAGLGLLALLIALTAFLSAAGLRLFDRAANDALQRQVAAAPVVQRTIMVSAARALFGLDAEATVVDWQAEGERARAGFPASIGDIVGEGRLAISSNRLRVSDPPLYPMFMTLRYRDGIEDLLDLVDGRWPVSTGDRLPPVAEFPPTDSGEQGRPVATNYDGEEMRRFEIAVQRTTAQALGLRVGSRLEVDPDLRDTLFATSIIRSVRVALAPTELEVTGLYSVRDAESDAWLGDNGLTFDDLGVGLDSPVANINGYVAPDALPGLVASGLPFEFDWRYLIDAERLDADAIAQTEEGLRLVESQSPGSAADGDASAELGLMPLLERQRSLRTASESILGLAATAPLALATGSLVMAAVLLSRRRLQALVLARGRGAAPRVLFTASMVESVLVAALASATGFALALALVPAADMRRSLIAITALALIGVGVLMAAAAGMIRQPLAELEGGGTRSARRADPRRLVLELSVVVVAVAGAYLLRQRGMSAASVAFDPFLAAVPPLIALATGITAIRLYRPAMGLAGWLADRRRDLVLTLGARIIARGAASSLPVLILLLAVAIAAFTSVVSASIDQAQQRAAWFAAGADVRLQAAGTDLPAATVVAETPGVEAIAVGYVEPRVRPPINTGVGTLTVHAVDATGLANVVNGSPIEPNWPAAFFDVPSDEPIPAIAATRLTGGRLSLGRGDTFPMTVLGRAVEVQIVDVRTSMLGLTVDDAFVIIPLAWLEHAAAHAVEPTVIWARASMAGAEALAELGSVDQGEIRVVSRYAEYSELRNEPLVGAVGNGFLAALGVSVAYAVLTILGALILSASRRTRDVAILRTLGLSRGQQTRLTLLEHAPPILVALPVGIALGIGVALAVTPALNLGALAGSQGPIAVTINWATLAAVSVALAVVALAAVIVGTWLSRRAAVLNALRISSD